VIGGLDVDASRRELGEIHSGLEKAALYDLKRYFSVRTASRSRSFEQAAEGVA
jgi:hypothetical protein